MQSLFNLINKPFGWILENIAGLAGGNFAVAVFIFTLLINIILIPLSLKSQKASVQQTRIKPKLDELKKRYGDDKQKYSEAMQKLYQDENVSMTGGGCLPMVLRLVLMMSIYYLITQPLTYLMHVSSDVISKASEALELASKNASGVELKIIDAVQSGQYKSEEISSALESMDFSLFGINLTETPKFSFDIFHEAQLIWLIPIFAFLAQMLTSVISMAIQKKNNPDAPSMAGMMLTMPLISLFIGFGLPGGVGFYWICSSLIGGLIQSAIQLLYGPHRMLARTRAGELLKQQDFESKQLQKFNSPSTEE